MSKIEALMNEYKKLEEAREPLISITSTARTSNIVCAINAQIDENVKAINDCIKKGEGSASDIISYMKYFYKN